MNLYAWATPDCPALIQKKTHFLAPDQSKKTSFEMGMMMSDSRLLDSLLFEYALEETLGACNIIFIKMLNDDGHIGMILCQKFNIEIVV